MKLKALAIVLCLTACGGDYREAAVSASRTPFGSQSVQIIGGSITADGSTLAGSGTVLFEEIYPSFESSGSYALSFTLEEGGSVTLVSHGDSALNGGYEMTFLRQPSGSLLATITAQGETRDTNLANGTNKFADLNATLPILLQVDVHNNETPTHSIVWNRELSETAFPVANAIFNSEDNDNSPGIGTGTRWGLRLDRAVVTRADRSAAKASHP